MNSTPPSQPSMDWAACAELLRLQQWQMSQRILATADALYQQVRLDPGPATASLDHRASRMVQIAIKLGRQAAGMDLKPAIPTGPPPLTPEEQADVDAFYPATPAPTPPPPAPTASANVTPPVAPAPPQPGPAGSTLNPQPASPSTPESKIENQNSKVPQPAPATPLHPTLDDTLEARTDVTASKGQSATENSPSPGGPQFAERTSILGHLYCGGLGKPLGWGEGGPLHPLFLHVTQSPVQCPATPAPSAAPAPQASTPAPSVTATPPAAPAPQPPPQSKTENPNPNTPLPTHPTYPADWENDTRPRIIGPIRLRKEPP